MTTAGMTVVTSFLGKLLSVAFLGGVAFSFHLIYVGMRLRPTDPDFSGALGLWVGVVVVISFSLLAGVLAYWLLPREAVVFRRVVFWGVASFLTALAVLFVYGTSHAGR